MDINEFYSNYSKFRAHKPSTSYMKIPILRSYTDEKNTLKSDTVLKLKQCISNQSKILDIGGGDRKIKVLLDAIGVSCTYKSMDIEENNFHDYYDINEISEKFSHVLLFNILEHLAFDTGLNYITKAQDVLKDEGMLLISVPNIWHPNHMYRCDITHIKAYPYQDLYGLLSYMGFKDIEMYRIYHRPLRLSMKRFIIEKLKIYFSLIMDVDFAINLWIIAKKRG